MNENWDYDNEEKVSVQWAVLVMLILMSSLFFVGILLELDYWKDACLK